ncbi:hypothetical protein LN042_32720 [Kitasatospora sp. RB6PN24]|uniref:hypothetical protein n=1 Tax=Kitasatospora humi TaxID=2893891 RepID=UPI001E5FA932|nr:hypothetical protein [Kitasatospora humi]MCC9311776.1 hypothetical protein [Kitasatospora humi]
MELPDGWRLEGTKLTYAHDLSGWALEVTFRLDLLWMDGPAELSVVVHDVDASEESNGLTADLLRSIPMGEIRKTGVRLRSQLGYAVGPFGSGVVLDRVETDLEYALMSEVYIQLIKQGFRSPISRLADGWGMSRNTISGRIRRARAMGFLDGPAGKPADRLTEKSRSLLEGHSGSVVDQRG